MPAYLALVNTQQVDDREKGTLGLWAVDGLQSAGLGVIGGKLVGQRQRAWCANPLLLCA
jgi:hypothetical protein